MTTLIPYTQAAQANSICRIVEKQSAKDWPIDDADKVFTGGMSASCVCPTHQLSPLSYPSP